MNINLTLLGQMMTFAVFIWVTMKYIWPPVMQAMEERRGQIAEGLEAAERSKRELELAQGRVAEQLREAKTDASKIIEEAKVRATHLVEEGKAQAREEGSRLIVLAKAEAEQEAENAKQQVLKQLSSLIVSGAEKILHSQIDEAKHAQLLDQLIEEI